MRPLEMIVEFRLKAADGMLSRKTLLGFLDELKASLLAVIAEQQAVRINHKPQPWISSTATLIGALLALAEHSDRAECADGVISTCLRECAQRLEEQHAQIEALKARVAELEGGR